MQEAANAFVGSESQNGDISAITVAILKPKTLTKSDMLNTLVNYKVETIKQKIGK